jgi:NAD+ diphosphatase
MLFCPDCGNVIYPKIAPAVIVGIIDGDKILMTKYAGREYKKYSLVAGFCEIGEAAEDTVRREVMEEVGLKVKNIRYYKSQPWGFDSNLLMGFFADLDGENVITRDETELAVAEWIERKDTSGMNDGISLTREMIDVFCNNVRKSVTFP